MRPIQFLFLLVLIPLSAHSQEAADRSQETAESLARRAQLMLLANPGVTMTFDLPGEGGVSATVDFNGKHIRIESPSSLIISDGATVWNVSKSKKRVTIDNVEKTNSPFTDPASLFRFADNYSASLVSHSGTTYKLELTPHANIASLVKAAGNAQSIMLELRVTPKSLKILQATASTTSGTSQTSKLKITPLKHIQRKDFIYAPVAGVKVLDLRE